MLKTKQSISHITLSILILLLGAISLSSCEIIGDIFEAGVWTGIILIALIVIVIIYIFSRFRRRG